MRILIEMGHPAHVHFFRGAYGTLLHRGHQVKVVTRRKEMTESLLDRYQIPYLSLSAPARSTAGLALELSNRWRKIYRVIREHQIEATMSISGISTGVPAFLARIPNLVFTDTEDATLSNRLAFPFATEILTPAFFRGELGAKHRRYQALHELAYLKNFDFNSAADECKQLGLPNKFSLLRLIAHDALHDRDITGLRIKEIQSIVDRLRRLGEVFITSQGPLPDQLKAMQASFPIEKVHAVLSQAQVFVGESPTMAVESALLGVPAYLISNRVNRLGNMIDLEAQHRLLINCVDWNDFLKKWPSTPELFENESRAWKLRAQAFRNQSDSVADLIVQSIERSR